MCALIALLLFVLAAFGVHIGSVNLVDIGLAFLALSLLVGIWPFGTFIRTRRNQG